MKEIRYKAIGVIHSPFKEPIGVPIQPTAAKGVRGTVELDPEYVDGLKDIEGFSHIILIFHLHLSEGYSLKVKPFLDDHLHGLFTTRAPRRPNPIGISVVRLLKVEGRVLHVEGVDMVDGTPLLDIKPYVPGLDDRKAERVGWLFGKVDQMHNTNAAERFS
jgi:tRNA-Thr(GGU) m(6)t(6)A37 methyltransferase TsaA